MTSEPVTTTGASAYSAEQAHAELLLSELELEHNLLKNMDSMESAVEIDRNAALTLIDEIVMGAQGVLNALPTVRSELVTQAHNDVDQLVAVAKHAEDSAFLGLAKTVTQSMQRAAHVAADLAVALDALPGHVPMPTPTPAPAGGPPGAAADGDIAGQRRPSWLTALAIALVGTGFALVAGRRP